MIETMVFSYAALIGFVFTGASRNQKAQRAHPPQLRYIGFVLAGSLATLSLLLLASIPLGIEITILS